MNFRIPAELKGQLEEAAAASGRSLTAEMVRRLQESFEDSTELRDAHALLASHQRALVEAVGKLPPSKATPEMLAAKRMGEALLTKDGETIADFFIDGFTGLVDKSEIDQMKRTKAEIADMAKRRRTK